MFSIWIMITCATTLPLKSFEEADTSFCLRIDTGTEDGKNDNERPMNVDGILNSHAQSLSLIAVKCCSISSTVSVRNKPSFSAATTPT